MAAMHHDFCVSVNGCVSVWRQGRHEMCQSIASIISCRWPRSVTTLQDSMISIAVLLCCCAGALAIPTIPNEFSFGFIENVTMLVTGETLLLQGQVRARGGKWFDAFLFIFLLCVLFCFVL